MYKTIMIFKERKGGRERGREGEGKGRKLFYAEEYQLIKCRRKDIINKSTF